eukprot:maker-scaffold626_size122949-snap-gene-0.36 protein:Tk11478 transcript:maker-scaffold626_size122949-snap-gene-0.36-mRNA-1 annotation:"cytochrome c biogenesis protein"
MRLIAFIFCVVRTWASYENSKVMNCSSPHSISGVGLFRVGLKNIVVGFNCSNSNQDSIDDLSDHQEMLQNISKCGSDVMDQYRSCPGNHFNKTIFLERILRDDICCSDDSCESREETTVVLTHFKDFSIDSVCPKTNNVFSSPWIIPGVAGLVAIVCLITIALRIWHKRISSVEGTESPPISSNEYTHQEEIANDYYGIHDTQSDNAEYLASIQEANPYYGTTDDYYEDTFTLK